MIENGLSTGENFLFVHEFLFILSYCLSSFHFIIIVNTGQKEILEKEEETIIEVVMMVSKKGRRMKLKMINNTIYS